MTDSRQIIMRDKLAAPEPERWRSERHKLSIEVSTDPHRRFVKICTTRKLPVNEAVREVLERAFPG